MTDRSSTNLRYVFAPLASPPVPPDLEMPGCMTRPIHKAVKEGGPEDVLRLLAEGADPNVYDDNGITPLYWADDLQKVKILLDAGADPRLMQYGDFTPVHKAAMKGDDESRRILNFYLDHFPLDALMQKTARSGENILHLLAHHGGRAVDELQKLIDMGFCVNEPDANGHTPLDHACSGANAAMAMALIGAGADVARSGNGSFRLFCAIDALDARLVQALVDHGVVVNPSEESSGIAPLVEAANTRGDNAEIVKILLDAGADVRARSGHLGLAAPHGISLFNAEEMIPLLKKAHADFNAQDRNGRTPMHVFLNKIAANRLGPVDEAQELQIIGVLAAMIEAGANPQIADRDGRRPYEYAYSFSFGRVVDYLEAAGERQVKRRGHVP